MGERPSEKIGGPLVGNGLSSDILRASVIEYYSNCHPNSHPDYLNSSSLQKSGSITQINGLTNGGQLHERRRNSPSSTEHTLQQTSRPPPHRCRSDRPHRTHSERGNKFSPGRNLNRAIENRVVVSSAKGLYRSNSSLDLDHSADMPDERTGVLRRDYGSASSLDVISTTGESFFAMLREFRSDNYDQRSPGPPKILEYLRGKVDPPPSTQNAANTLVNGPDSLDDAQSPKLKTKFHRLWDMKEKKVKAKVLGSEQSLFKKLRGNKTDIAETGSKGSDNSLDVELRIEEKLRKKAFAHYDCQSVLANLSCASRLRNLLTKRRNTTTGASAASMLNKTPASSTENLSPLDADTGDGRSNELVLSCPFFRNELGGEEERMISLNRMTCKKQKVSEDAMVVPPTLHKPNMAYGLSVLEKVSISRWQHRFCPYQHHSSCMEKVDCGATCYRQFFHSQGEG